MERYCPKSKYLGFVYLWRDRKHKMYYLGSHVGAEDDGYIASAGPRFQRAFRKRPQDFKGRNHTDETKRKNARALGC